MAGKRKTMTSLVGRDFSVCPIGRERGLPSISCVRRPRRSELNFPVLSTEATKLLSLLSVCIPRFDQNSAGRTK